MPPFEVIELLKELNRQRIRTRHLARTVLEPEKIRQFINHFQKIEDVVLAEIEQGLGLWYIWTTLELQDLRARIEVLEQKK